MCINIYINIYHDIPEVMQRSGGDAPSRSDARSKTCKNLLDSDRIVLNLPLHLCPVQLNLNQHYQLSLFIKAF